MASVRHIDCTLCSDCVYACPLKNTLTVNNKPQHKYLAPVSVLVLIASGLIAASVAEFTTISLRWGNAPGTPAVLTQTGMKSITCYGSSMALAGTLENIEGIVGVDTYAKSHRVKVYYDSSAISEKEVRAALFSSSKIEIRRVQLAPNEQIGVFDIGILHLFDAVDFKDLAALLGGHHGILGFETRFGEPVRTTVYYLPSRITPVEIRDQLNKKYILRDGNRIELTFETVGQGDAKNSIPYAQYQRKIFDGYDDNFNNYELYEPEKLSVFTFPMPEAGDPDLQKDLDVFASHLSKDQGIVRFSTYFDGVVTGCVYYDAAKTNEAAIKSALAKNVLTYFVSDGETEEIPNPFHIGRTAESGKQ
jgi:copper chaperone CopZ